MKNTFFTNAQIMELFKGWQIDPNDQQRGWLVLNRAVDDMGIFTKKLRAYFFKCGGRLWDAYTFEKMEAETTEQHTQGASNDI